MRVQLVRLPIYPSARMPLFYLMMIWDDGAAAGPDIFIGGSQ